MSIRRLNPAATAIMLIALVSGCAWFRPAPPITPLAASWNRYKACVDQSHNATVQCERLRLAYETQLNQASR